MARLKRSSIVLQMARQKLAGLKQISPPPTLASDLTLESYEAEINGFSDDQDNYNGVLAALDERTNELDKREQRLADLNQRITYAVRGLYGSDSNELEQVGGTRRSDRKRPARSTKPPAAA